MPQPSRSVIKSLLQDLAYQLGEGENLLWSDIEEETGLSPEAAIQAALSVVLEWDEFWESPILPEALEMLMHGALLDVLIGIRSERKQSLNSWRLIQRQLTQHLLSPAVDSSPLYLERSRELMLMTIGMIASLGLHPDDDFADSIQQWQIEQFEAEPVSIASPDQMLAELERNITADGIVSEFEFCELFFNQLAFMPEELVNQLMFELLSCDHPLLREGALLALLHTQPAIREGLLSALSLKPCQQKVSTTGLRRMILVRNWLPSSQRQQLDPIIRQLRQSGLNCASTETETDFTLLRVAASSIDGAGAQSVICLFKQQNQFCLAGVVLKERLGVVDTFFTEPTSRRQCEESLRMMADEIYSLDVEPDYLRQMLPHYLTLNAGGDQPPAPELLQIVEVMGLQEWQPQPFDDEACLAELQQKHGITLDSQTIAATLKRTRTWLQTRDFAASWFEQGDEIEARIHQYVQQGVPELGLEFTDFILGDEAREKWYHRFVKLALWADSNIKKRGPNCADFVVLANALKQPGPLENIPLMRAIALETYEMNPPYQGEPSAHSLLDEDEFFYDEDLFDEDEDYEFPNLFEPSSLPVHSEKIGRNDPCPCGSGKKYKKCCGR